VLIRLVGREFLVVLGTLFFYWLSVFVLDLCYLSHVFLSKSLS